MERYDPITDAWVSVSHLPEPRTAFGVAAVAGRIYVIGGETVTRTSGTTVTTYLDTVRAYDPVHDTWTTRAALPFARSHLGAAVGADGRIYAIGGMTDDDEATDAVSAYDPVDNAWTSITSMTTARGHLAVTVDDVGIIYALGGYNASPKP